MFVRKNGLFLLIFVAVVAFFGVSACGDDDNGGNNNGGETANADGDGDGSADGDGGEVGDEEESSFDVSIETESGDVSDASGKQANEEASEETWGAVLNTGRLTITLVTEAGVSITANVETSEGDRAPGSFTVGEPPEGNNVILVDAMQGTAFSSRSGTITLENCPTAMGQKMVGSFNNVVLADDFEVEEDRTLSGDFDVMVYGVVGGGLFCEEPQGDGDADADADGDGDGSQGGQCNYTVCEDDAGACCPYAQCMGTCNTECLFNDAGCSMGMNPAACATCIDSCYVDTCGISDQCVDAGTALDTCGVANGCDEFEDEADEEACLENFCCSELKAAF